MFDLPVLKEAVKSEDDKQKAYMLVFSKKSVSVYFNLIRILWLK